MEPIPSIDSNAYSNLYSKLKLYLHVNIEDRDPALCNLLFCTNINLSWKAQNQQTRRVTENKMGRKQCPQSVQDKKYRLKDFHIIS